VTTSTSLRLERPFLDKRLAVCLSPDADAFAFADFADQLAKQFNGEIVERVGPLLGCDEVYWDLRLRGQLFTLHRQHFLGVFLCATDDSSEAVLPELLPFAEGFLRQRSSVLARFRAFWRHLVAS
jgi:hypothetical protein